MAGITLSRKFWLCAACLLASGLAAVFAIVAVAGGNSRSEGVELSIKPSEEGTKVFALGETIKIDATSRLPADSQAITISAPGVEPAFVASQPGETSVTLSGVCTEAGRITVRASAGNRPVSEEITIVRIHSVDIEKDDVCAGGVDSEVHKTHVIVRIDPAVAYSLVKVQLVGGEGWTSGDISVAVPYVGTIPYGGEAVPARLDICDRILTGAKPTRTETIAAGSDGAATGVLTSSNRIGDSATVIAFVGPEGGPVAEDTIDFGEPHVDLQLPDRLTQSFEIRTEVTYGGKPVPGHEINVVVTSVSVPEITGAGRTGRKLAVPVRLWSRYAGDTSFSGGVSNPALAKTGILNPDYPGLLRGFFGSTVSYSAYDLTALKDPDLDDLRRLAAFGGFLGLFGA